MIGRTVGNYRIVRELGAGGMGAVYEGVDVMVERRVAIKVLRAEIASNPELIERFRVEATTLAKLNHPGTALLYNFFREGVEYFMVMEFVPGRTLEAILRDSGKLPPDWAARILGQALDGMAHAHRMGVLHRDIKPANIMVTGEGVVKVTDFGIARMLNAARMTREGRIIGTLEYIAPERIKGEEADIRSDLYSAGVVLFETLSGRLPFVSETDFGLMQAHLNQPPPQLSALGVAIPPALEAVLLKALAKTPAERFQTAEEFRAALAAATPSAPAMQPTRLATAPPPAVAATRLAASAAPPPAARRLPRLPVKWIAVAAGVLLAAVLVIMAIRARNAAATPQAVLPSPAPVQQAPLQPPPAPALPPELQGLQPAGATPEKSVPLNDILGDEKSSKPAPSVDAEEKRKAALRALEEGGADTKKSKAAKREDALRALEK